MWQAIAAVVAAIVSPVLGAGLRASRRNRLANRARALYALADDIQEHDTAGANSLRRLAVRRVQQVVDLERQALSRRFDPAWPFALAVFLLPAGLASFFAWHYTGWWTWPVLVISGIWTAIIVAVGTSQMWKEHEAAVGSG